MRCTEKRLDRRKTTRPEQLRIRRERELLFRANHAVPDSEDYFEAVDEIFGAVGSGSWIAPPLGGTGLSSIRIGQNVTILGGLLAMGRGGIDIEDGVWIGPNVQLITNNHDFYDRQILVCRPVRICKGAYIGAGACILPGVRIGRYAEVLPCAVVTRDVPDFAAAGGNPAHVVLRGAGRHDAG